MESRSAEEDKLGKQRRQTIHERWRALVISLNNPYQAFISNPAPKFLPCPLRRCAWLKEIWWAIIEEHK